MAKLIPQAKHYERPETETELVSILKDTDSSDFFIAGGTSMSFSKPNAQRVIDLSRLPLKGCQINNENNVEIGALTTIGDLEQNPLTATFCAGILRHATDKLASTPLRNLITVGGNLAAGYAWCDLPVVLLALDARYECLPAREIKPIPSDGKISFRRLSGKGEIVSRIILSGEFSDARGAFIKYARTSSDLSMVSVAVTMKEEQGKMRSVRIVVGGLVPTPLRLKSVEQMLEGQVANTELFEKAAGTVNLTPRPDTRATSEYRLEVLKTLISRASAGVSL
ncbi:FAD binding domain-containing protein [bacterium]|nr:FAD binding domain-containing protein [bacterium]